MHCGQYCRWFQTIMRTKSIWSTAHWLASNVKRQPWNVAWISQFVNKTVLFLIDSYSTQESPHEAINPQNDLVDCITELFAYCRCPVQLGSVKCVNRWNEDLLDALNHRSHHRRIIINPATICLHATFLFIKQCADWWWRVHLYITALYI